MRAPIQIDFSAAQIALASEARWREMPFGIDFKLRPMTGLVAAVVEAEVSSNVHAFHAGGDVLSRFGFDESEMGMLADVHIAGGFAYLMLAVSRARAMLEEWNLQGEAGEPIEITELNIARLFYHGVSPGTGGMIMTDFMRKSDETTVRLVAEKNVSAASPSTFSEGAAQPAATAVSPEPHAPPAASVKKGRGAPN